MGLWQKLMDARSYVRRKRGPDSYFQYQRKREEERQDAAQGRGRTRDRAEAERGEAERKSEYEDRYRSDRESDVADKRTQRSEETEPDP